MQVQVQVNIDNQKIFVFIFKNHSFIRSKHNFYYLKKKLSIKRNKYRKNPYDYYYFIN
jgi:hypothetical protein